MIIKQLELETVCGITSKLPVNTLPEIAFAGRSNVGKSSLINGLVGRKSFARTSGQPGKTQTINFYKINNAFYFTDLPGYGYARVSQVTREKWGKMIEKYLRTSKQLRSIFLLLDIRHEPTADDKQMFEWILANGFTPVIIATKADKISRGQAARQKEILRRGVGAGAEIKIYAFSAVTKQGVDEIRAEIETLVAQSENDGSVENEQTENPESVPSEQL